MTSLYELTTGTIEYIESLMEESHIDSLPEDVKKTLLDSISQDAAAKQLNVAAYILNLESDVSQMKGYIDNMDSRKKIVESKIKRMKDLLAWSMQALAMTETNGPQFTIKLKEGLGRVEIENESLVPSKYKVKQPEKISKEAIQEDIRKGVVIEGIRFVKEKILSIK